MAALFQAATDASTRLITRTNGGKAYSEWGNQKGTGTSGVLPWAQARFLDAYLLLADATGNEDWLARFEDQMRAALQIRDIVTGARDYRGRSGPVWATAAFDTQVPYVWLVHTAILAELLARGARILESAGRMTHVETFADAAAAAMKFHEDEFATGEVAGVATTGYWYADDAPYPPRGRDWTRLLPWNMQAAAAAAHIAIWRLRNEAAHLERATTIWRCWTSTLRPPPGLGPDARWWLYMAGKEWPEDLSHASMTFQMVKCFEEIDFPDAQDVSGQIAATVHSLVIDESRCLLAATPESREGAFLPQVLMFAGAPHPGLRRSVNAIADGLIAMSPWLDALRDDYRGVVVQGLAGVAAAERKGGAAREAGGADPGTG